MAIRLIFIIFSYYPRKYKSLYDGSTPLPLPHPPSTTPNDVHERVLNGIIWSAGCLGFKPTSNKISP